MPDVRLVFYRRGFFFFFLFFRRLISAVTEWISTKLGHIFTYDCYLKMLVRTPSGIHPPRAEGKKSLWGPTLKFDRTYLCNSIWYQQSERNLSIYSDSLHASKFGELWSRNWERLATFCPPPKFSHWETLPALPHRRYITDSRQTLARVT